MNISIYKEIILKLYFHNIPPTRPPVHYVLFIMCVDSSFHSNCGTTSGNALKKSSTSQIQISKSFYFISTYHLECYSRCIIH